MRGINERHRHHRAPHAHDPFLEEDALEALLASRSVSLLEFAHSLDTSTFLRANGVSEAEISAIRAKLNAPAR
jgi:hypothetical protein